MNFLSDDVRRNPYPLYDHLRGRSPVVYDPQTGRWQPADNSGIYAETGFDLQGKFLTDLTRAVRAMGMLPEMVYHEGGPGQQEISIHHSPALRAAEAGHWCLAHDAGGPSPQPHRDA